MTKVSIRHRLACSLITFSLIHLMTDDVHADNGVDIVSYFRHQESENGAGLARKTKLVDVRIAAPGEIIVTTIKGEGKETQSPPAKPGDMVVRNRCPETGNEEILVSREAFLRRYKRTLSKVQKNAWTPYWPIGLPMRFIRVPMNEREFIFNAPWGERMMVRPGDVIVQDPTNIGDTYRVAKAAFDCTYEIQKEPSN